MKRAILEINDDLLTDILKIFQKDKNEFGLSVIKNPLPDDARPIRIFRRTDFSSNSGELSMLIESEEFDDVGRGEKYPILDCPVVQKRYVEEDKEKEMINPIHGGRHGDFEDTKKFLERASKIMKKVKSIKIPKGKISKHDKDKLDKAFDKEFGLQEVECTVPILPIKPPRRILKEDVSFKPLVNKIKKVFKPWRFTSIKGAPNPKPNPRRRPLPNECRYDGETDCVNNICDEGCTAYRVHRIKMYKEHKNSI